MPKTETMVPSKVVVLSETNGIPIITIANPPIVTGNTKKTVKLSFYVFVILPVTTIFKSRVESFFFF